MAVEVLTPLSQANTIVVLYAWNVEPSAQFALIVKLDEPANDGIPERVAWLFVPVKLSVTPAGSAPVLLKLQVSPLVTVRTCE